MKTCFPKSPVYMMASYGWSDKKVTSLLQVVQDMLLDKKMLCLMSMEYQNIHACHNDCIVYINEFEEIHKCPKYGVSWYKVKDDDECTNYESTKKGPPVKVLWYLPIIPRFKHLFANTDDAKELTWHANGRNCNGML